MHWLQHGDELGIRGIELHQYWRSAWRYSKKLLGRWTEPLGEELVSTRPALGSMAGRNTRGRAGASAQDWDCTWRLAWDITGVALGRALTSWEKNRFNTEWC
jgi:hypothetical protein